MAPIKLGYWKIRGVSFSFTFIIIARKISKYGVFSVPYFPVFSPNTGKYGPEKTPYLDTFYTVKMILTVLRSFFRKYKSSIFQCFVFELLFLNFERLNIFLIGSYFLPVSGSLFL